MIPETLLSILAFSAIGQAAPARKSSKVPLGVLHHREVPQEHSHNPFLASVRASLASNNPDNMQAPVFGLLDNAAAAAGQGSITDTDCLHQATADQACANAKIAGDVDGMTNALIYAALERNTAISQHQIASVGGDPQEALKSGTFAPGDVNDPTAKGNSCDIEDDEPGCIFTQNLLVEDATAEEIDAAVAGTPPTPALTPLSVGQCDTQEKVCKAASAAQKHRKRALDFGSCTDPTIKFADGLDGRKEAAFAPNNDADFNVGSALNIGVISRFIC
ncbi:MAG: hypothetical protein Q9166_001735 [cf. Caloplaca sp. 2 TL-2023]